jgi:hypothetical protein
LNHNLLQDLHKTASFCHLPDCISSMEGKGKQQHEQQFKSIYLGKGRDLQEHPGNIYFRSFVEAFTEQYEIATKNEKRHVVTGVMRLLELDGFRFFKLVEKGVGDINKDSWKPATEGEIYAKVGHVFRSCRRYQFKFLPGGQARKAAARAVELKQSIRDILQARSKGMGRSSALEMGKETS